jgi:hypothetical protein
MPTTTYTLRCRQQACEQLEAGESAEGSIPIVRDPDRSPDVSTLRRWFSQLRVLRMLLGCALWRIAKLPTSVALDWMMIGRILHAEARSP